MCPDAFRAPGQNGFAAEFCRSPLGQPARGIQITVQNARSGRAAAGRASDHARAGKRADTLCAAGHPLPWRATGRNYAPASRTRAAGRPRPTRRTRPRTPAFTRTDRFGGKAGKRPGGGPPARGERTQHRHFPQYCPRTSAQRIRQVAGPLAGRTGPRSMRNRAGRQRIPLIVKHTLPSAPILV